MKLVNTIAKVYVSIALIIIPMTSVAVECSAQSGAYITPLLELYTSEGCSSCPPADKWLSAIKADPHKVVPLAFHVDYWDYIGWKDRFSKAEYSDRQRQIAAFSGGRYVYTPQFIFNGQDFRNWNESRLNRKIDSSLNTVARAHLKLNVSTQTNGELLLNATGEAANGRDFNHAAIYIAFYENKLASQVNAGENNGRELKHDYVVRDLLGAFPLDHKNEFSKTIKLPAALKNRHAGAVIFMQDSRNGDILQSLQLPFCG